MAAGSGLATRLYRGELGVNVVGRRRVWFSVAGAVLLIAILSFGFLGFKTGIDFKGGNEFQVPASVGTLEQVEAQVGRTLGDVGAGTDAKVVSAQRLGGTNPSYLIRTSPLPAQTSLQVRERVAGVYNIAPNQISNNQVSAAWGKQVTQKALIGVAAFLAVVIIYLIFRFEWRMAVAAVASLLLDLMVAATVYSLVGFEVTPSTVIGFLTILGFALYDVVVVFDKVQENTRGITASSTQTYAEAANLAVNQTLMRSINTGLVALLPVGGLLFIGAGLLGAGTLKDLGLVLFIGMGAAVYSSIFFATPVLVTLKEYEPRIRLHTQRVLAKRSGAREERKAAAKAPKQGAPAKAGTKPKPAVQSAADEQAEVATAGTGTPAKSGSPRPGARPAKRGGGGRGGPRGGRPSGAKRR